ncbi:hypothetical protein FJQ98_15520 [Lysinibacillus agricola]|uniref:8-oxoguanine DNA glycosylase N-terminal domain-containing protein n=1 Tax=Lysinibacillus agricola TaxID=2590012 RepID=A0ABX7ALA4_9BACI|nr:MULTISPECIES: DNA glycosylase [Lysinibacillus]QQP10666.1 hypothetical protein FJQ98_15520 [Lysinibacillus agricola]
MIQLHFTVNKLLIARIPNTVKFVEDWQIDAITQFVREWFDLDNDLTAFYEMAKVDSLLKMPVEKFKRLRIIGIPDLFEALC